MSASLILDEQPLQVLPSLAKLLGLDHAIVLQQLHWLLKRKGNGKVLADGEKYIFNTYEEWIEHFPWLSERTMRRVFCDLETRGLVLSCQPDGKFSRRKYYRISFGAMAKLTSEAAELAAFEDGQIDLIQNQPDWPLPLTETTTETTNRENTLQASPAVRKHDPSFDALCAFEGIPLSEVGPAGGRIGTALKAIRSINPNVTPSEIEARGKNYRSHFPTISTTATGLAKYWGKCSAPPVLSQRSNAPLRPLMR